MKKMLTFNLGIVTVTLYPEGKNVRVLAGNNTIILINQSIITIESLIKTNFDVVNDHYKSKLNDEMEASNINKISVSIVLYYLYVYNDWRNTYKNKENQSLYFDVKDFNNVATYDLIISFYKKKDYSNWIEKCALQLGMDIEEFKSLYNKRKEFYDKM